jgi:hypothetical protein
MSGTGTATGETAAIFGAESYARAEAARIGGTVWVTQDDGSEGYLVCAGAEPTEEEEAAVEAWWQDGDWDTSGGTLWLHPTLHPLDGGQAPGRQLVVEIPPPEPTCPGHRAHEWADGSVQGHGGGVITVETCRRCGVRLTTDTWATDPETGEQGLRTIRYDAPESDDREELGV